jgi:hypothetical protein
MALIVAWAAGVDPGRAQQVILLPNSFITGEGYIRMDETGRSQYLMGLFDGIMAGTLFGGSQAQIQALKSCNLDRSNIQLAEILYRYVKDHPEHWHLSASVLFFNRMIELCPQARPG